MRKKIASCQTSREAVPAAWAVEELAGAKLPDKRLVQRAQIIMTQFGQQPSASIPQACGQWPEIKAAYRFFDNEGVDPQQLLAPHSAATVRRMQRHPVVLAVQDTTSLNYSAHPRTRGLGPIGNKAHKPIGIFLHTSIAVSVEGEALGTLAAQTWAGDARRFGSSRDAQRRNGQPISEKESQRWLDSLTSCQQVASQCPETVVVNVADREADIYELFAQALGGPKSVHLLVRSQHNRRVEDPAGKLWPRLRQQPPAATLQVQTPRRTGRPSRTAALSIRFTEVSLRSPILKEGQPALRLWAIEAREEHPPKGHEPILWRLLTTLPVWSAAQAVEKVRWYAKRWQIEVLHKVLKSGCQIEQRQLETAARLRRVLMLDLIVAWRVMQLNQAARQRPDASAQEWLQTTEWTVLWCYFHRGQKPPATAPTIRQAVRWIGHLGGFIGRKSDGEPGPIVLWRGLQRLHDLTETLSILKNCG